MGVAVAAWPAMASLLARQLFEHFQAASHCDCAFEVQDCGTIVCAHRAVLRRNPYASWAGASCSEPLALPSGVSIGSLRSVLAAHYLENGLGDQDATYGASCQPLQELRESLPQTEWDLLESIFGPLQPERWLSLSDALEADEDLCDCHLELSDGSCVHAHRMVLSRVGSCDYFSALFSWPGGDCVCVRLPPELDRSTLQALLDLKYGRDLRCDDLIECIYYADYFGWDADVAEIHRLLESLIAQDADHAIRVFAYCAEGAHPFSIPPRLREQAYISAVRWFLMSSDAAKETLSSETKARLRLLSRIRNRFGHLCSDIEEYLRAAGDDLVEWQAALSPEAPLSARIALDNQWEHWHALVSELGRLEPVPSPSSKRTSRRTSCAKDPLAWSERMRARRFAARAQAVAGA